MGSANLDLVVEVDKIPVAGETVLGGDLRRIPGGKGANQAVAAARLGRRVAMVGRVGDDDAGAMLRAAMDSAGVDTTCLLATEGTPSGTALIAVGADGDNAIVVSPGANGRLSAADVENASDVLACSRGRVAAVGGAAGGRMGRSPRRPGHRCPQPGARARRHAAARSARRRGRDRAQPDRVGHAGGPCRVSPPSAAWTPTPRWPWPEDCLWQIRRGDARGGRRDGRHADRRHPRACAGRAAGRHHRGRRRLLRSSRRRPGRGR